MTDFPWAVTGSSQILVFSFQQVGFKNNEGNRTLKTENCLPGDSNLRHRIPLLVVLFLALCGCGGEAIQDKGPTGKLSGKVTYQGRKITLGRVVVVSEDGKHQSSGEISERAGANSLRSVSVCAISAT